MLPETDDDAVRIITIHGAKGLEFPIAIVSGMTTQAQARSGGVQVLFPPTRDTTSCGISKHASPPRSSSATQPIDEQMGFHEKLRLLYVACTRARDHLVVSVHRTGARTGPRRRTDVDRTPSCCGTPPTTRASWTGSSRDRRRRAASPVPRAVDARRPSRAWARVARRARRARSRRGARRRVSVGHRASREPRPTPAAAHDPGLAKDARDLELPPWNKGRYGTAIGRAVHAVLQTVDLATGAGLDDTAAAQAAAEGVLGHEDDDRRARHAVALATPHRARRGRTHGYWREMYVAVPVDGMTLEGYVDLVYRDPDGLVVVDYKTDAWRDERRPRRQGRALPAPGRVVRARARGGHRRARRRVRVRVPRRHGRRRADRQRPAGGDGRGTSTSRGVRRSRDEHQHAADRAGERPPAPCSPTSSRCRGG